MDKPTQAAEMVASTINPAEIAADMSAVECSRALTAALEARQLAGLPLRSALRPIDKLAQAVLHALAARRELAEAHPMFDRIGHEIGARMEDYGKGVPPAIVDAEAATATG